MELSQSRKTLLIRAGSAIVAVLVVVAVYFFFKLQGLRFLCYFSVVFGSRELIRILFKPDDSLLIKGLFSVALFMVFAISSHIPSDAGLAIAMVSISYCCVTVLHQDRFQDLESLLHFISKSFMGFLYLGLAPSFAFRLTTLPNGLMWFCTLLLVVFSGDTFAYLVGRKIGRTKLMPTVSPKKTVEGSLGGLMGSVGAALLMAQWINSGPLWLYAVMGACVGMVAQMGDLFESILKRVADRKDSGTIMPGHGGILDRLDGIFFGAPMMYFFAQFLQNHSI